MRILRFSLLLLTLFFVSSTAIVQDNPVFRIGVLDENFGTIHQGAQQAIDEINANGGATGADGTRFTLELVLQSPFNTNQAIANFRQASVIAIIGPSDLRAIQNNRDAFIDLNVPILSPIKESTLPNQLSNGTAFRTIASDSKQEQAIANHLANRTNIERLAVVEIGSDYRSDVTQFITSFSSYRRIPQQTFLVGDQVGMRNLTFSVKSPQFDSALIYGDSRATTELYRTLRGAGFTGFIISNSINLQELTVTEDPGNIYGIIQYGAWSPGISHARNRNFVQEHVSTFHTMPDTNAAASYDAIHVISRAIRLPGALVTNIPRVQTFLGVQGQISTDDLVQGELSSAVTITEYGAYGQAPGVFRYQNNQLADTTTTEEPTIVQPIATPIPTFTPTPLPTPTLDGVYAKIEVNRQNIRSGPGLNYDVIGQFTLDEQIRVIGASNNYEWYVVNYRGRQGWIASFILETIGNVRTLPIIIPPPTPTPRPPTATPTPEPKADIVVVSAAPAQIRLNQQFRLTITVENQGQRASGPFAVAATLKPGAVYNGATIGNLNAGQRVTIALDYLITRRTGNFTAVIVADLNEQVDEGTAGEANNDDYIYRYKVDRGVLAEATFVINPGTNVSLEGTGAADIRWLPGGGTLRPLNGAKMYLMTDVRNANQVHYDRIDPSIANTLDMPGPVLPNAYIGIITAEGNRGYLHVDNVVIGGRITITYRVYR